MQIKTNRLKGQVTQMSEIVTLGELLIDFVPTVSGVSLAKAPAFKKAPGGAPANVAAGLAKLKISAAFLGKVGNDPFGKFLKQTLDDAGVNTQGLIFSSDARTGLAFVTLREDGEREFMFYRHPSADMLYTPDEVDFQRIKSARIFHCGSISLISEPSKSATLAALETALENGVLISYDPNLRLALWPDPTAAKTGILSIWNYADIIKVSEDEIRFLTGFDDIDTAVKSLWHDKLKLLVVTLGRAGCRYYTPGFHGEVPGFDIKSIDTTGAGDGFVAGLLMGLLKNPDAWQQETQLKSICRFANAVGAFTTTKLGAIPALPTLEEINYFIDSKINNQQRV